MRKILTSLLGLVFLVAPTFAQTIEVTGKVTDATGSPIPNASIKVKGSKAGTSAGSDGTFKISVSSKAILVISAVGFEVIEVPANDNVNVSLKQQKAELAEVVVTALGVRREKKALNYAVTTVSKKDLELRSETDLARVLNGKAPGLNILNSSGLSGSGTSISIRGLNTLTGNSQPLFVVDGVPFDNSTNIQGNFTFGNNAPNRLVDIDPNNIENVSILKGLSATTLYGEAGRNGVILITTKNGSTDRQKSEVTVSQSYTITKAVLPEYNDLYGGGFDLSVGIAFFSNWGGRFTDPPAKVTHFLDKPALSLAFPEYQGVPYEYKFYNSVPRFFRTGSIKNTSVNASGSAGKLNYNVNYSYTDDQGYLLNNRTYKNTFGMGGNLKVTEKLRILAAVNYVNTDIAAPPTSDSYGNNPTNTSIFGNVLYTPTAVDLIGTPYENPLDHSSVYYRNGNDIQNPRWTLQYAGTTNKTNRIYGNSQVIFEPIKGLTVSYRIGYDNYSEGQSYYQHKGGTFFNTGILRTSTGTSTFWYNNFLTQYFTRIGSDFSVDINAGFDSRTRKYQQTGQTSTEQLVFGILNHSNFVSHDVRSEAGLDLNYQTEEFVQGVYARANIGFRDYAYLNFGGRNDWSSKLESANRSAFYPNVGFSVIPTSIIESLKSNKNINYIKLRLGYSTSANFPSAFYDTRAALSIATRVFVTNGGTSVNTNTLPSQLANPDLKPEKPSEIEAGLEGKFIDNRLDVDLTFYRRLNKDQILRRDIDPSSGYTFSEINAGTLRNKGIELALGYTVIRNKNWNWNVNSIFTLNRSLVSGIPDDIKQLVIAGNSSFGAFAKNGYPAPVIIGSAFERDPKTGLKVVDANGNYIVANDISVIGNPEPKFRLTGISTLSYKAFSWRMQWDYLAGGTIFASTADALLARGVTADTKFDRAVPVILPGVKEDGTPNDIQISATQAYFTNNIPGGGAFESGIYDQTVIRLREMSLSYTLPQNLISKTPFKSLNLVLTGSNLWYYAPNFPKYIHFDPEAASGTGVGNGRGLEFLSGPSARRIGVSVKLTF
ncbi:MAG TPA: SusC/RagA family TonB-linked outer membrane protein [Chitinophagaceae bacterium]|nr:SusC/RagA family TonB-linked outer membrane protein [Chitinophagaceae bacterium]